ncbi:MAG: AAA family ATPase [Pseudomonadota bacterium]
MATVILLNGPGSVGKSSLARALQGLASTTFLHVQMDAFLAMLPAALQDHPDGVAFESAAPGGHPEVHARTGPAGDRVLAGMRAAVGAMAEAGNNLIVDDVIYGDDARDGQSPVAEYRAALAGHRFLLVRLDAPLAVIEARERARGDRMLGLARWQVSRVHHGISYDLAVDTGDQSPADAARQVRDAFDL